MSDGSTQPADRATRRGVRRLGIVAIAAALALAWGPSEAHATHLARIVIDGTINPATADFIHESIDRAHDDGAAALVIELDTPGGLLTSTKSIVKDILAAPVPVIVYVAPSGAGAGSAGVFITLSAHVAVMAPGTNIGAAHPVAGGGQDIGGDMREKLENFTASFSEAIARKRGRNTEWAERAVRESVSITEREALDKHVVDLVAGNLEELIRQANGRKVEVAGKQVTLAFDGVRDADGRLRVVTLDMRLKQKVLNILADPNVAGLLMMAALAGLYIEFSHPGLVFPGVVGAISLLLALTAFQVLPINYTGLVLILLGVTLIIGELFVASGFLGMGGAVALILGALFFDTPEADLMIDRGIIYTIGGFLLVVMLLLMRVVGSALQRRPMLGGEGMVGQVGQVQAWAGETGTPGVHGEEWQAESGESLARGDAIEVLGRAGTLRLRVRRSGGSAKG